MIAVAGGKEKGEPLGSGGSGGAGIKKEEKNIRVFRKKSLRAHAKKGESDDRNCERGYGGSAGSS